MWTRFQPNFKLSVSLFLGLVILLPWIARAAERPESAISAVTQSGDDGVAYPIQLPARDTKLFRGDPSLDNLETIDGNCTAGLCDDNGCSLNPCSNCFQFQDGRLVPSRLWARSEYLLWWTRGGNLPALVTTSPVETLPADSGIFGRDGTSLLFGDQAAATGPSSGGRFTIGHQLCCSQGSGLEGYYLFLGTAANRYQADNSVIPILARPFFDMGANAESALLVSHPDFLDGSILVDATTSFQGAGVLLRNTICQRPCDRFDLLLGYRFSLLDDGIVIRQFSRWTAAQGIIQPNTTKDIFDSFDSENQFHGGEIGLAYRRRMDRWSLEILGKLALGNTTSWVRVDGSTVTTLPDGTSGSFPGGLLAQQTNIGYYEQNRFSVMPEFGVTLGWNLTCKLRATFGYSFIYWNNVIRAQNQIDRSLSQIPPAPPTGAQRPVVSMDQTDFWVQGMNFGLDYSF
jgi:hypothetical protein